MTYNPNQINPPEPPGPIVTCDQCQCDICELDADNFGSFDDPVWLCRIGGCVNAYLRDLVSEHRSFVNRSQKLIEQVTHGVSPTGHHDFGRWDIEPDSASPDGTTLTFRSKPNTGQYRVIRLAGE